MKREWESKVIMSWRRALSWIKDDGRLPRGKMDVALLPATRVARKMLDSFMTAICSQYARGTAIVVLERPLLYTIPNMTSFSPVGLHPEYTAPCTSHWWRFQLRM
jgi:hypothetical protein